MRISNGLVNNYCPTILQALRVPVPAHLTLTIPSHTINTGFTINTSKLSPLSITSTHVEAQFIRSHRSNPPIAKPTRRAHILFTCRSVVPGLLRKIS